MADPLRLSDIPDAIKLSDVSDNRTRLSDIEGEEIRPLWDKIGGIIASPLEASLTIGTSLLALAPSGFTGLVTGAVPGGKTAAEGTEAVREAITYKAKFPEGDALVSLVFWPFEKWSEYIATPISQAISEGDFGAREGIDERGRAFVVDEDKFEAHPIAGTISQTVLDIAPFVLGPKLIKQGVKKVKSSEKLAETANSFREVFAPISAGSQKARAAAKTYSNDIREASAMRNRELAILDKRFNRKELEEMGDALAQEEVAFAKGVEAKDGIDSLSMNQKTAAVDLVNKHKGIAEQAVELGIIPVSKDFYFPRVAIRSLGIESAKRIYSGRQVKVATVHAKKRKYETIEETEAAVIQRLGEDASINRNVKVLPLVTAELERAIAGKILINTIKEHGTKIGIDMVKYGTEDAAYFTLPHPAFREYRPRLERRAEGDLGPRGGKWKIARKEDGEPIFDPQQIKISREWELPLKAALDNPAGPVYQTIMKLKSKQMSLIMFSPIMHGQVIWGKVLPFQPMRTITLKNYRDGHKIQNIRGLSEKEQAKWQRNEGWVRQESQGEFPGSDAAMRQAIKDGYIPIESMGWMQRMTDIVGTPTLEAGRSTTASIAGALAKPFGKKAQAQAMRGVDWAGGIWHDKFLWAQIRAMGYGLWFNLRNQAIKKGKSPEEAGAFAAHMANRFTGSIPFEDMSAGVRATANVMLFSKSFTGTNIGLYKDATLGMPKAVESRVLEAGGSIAGNQWMNSATRRAASAALVKDIAFVYLLNSMLQNAIQYFKAENKDEALDDIVDQYSDSSERYADLAQGPLSAIYGLDELAAGSLNDEGKENRVFLGRKPDGTAIYIRVPLGKVGEDLLKVATSPVELGWNKLSPFVGFIAGTALNDKSKQRDFDIEVYDPDGSTLESIRDIFYYFLETSTPSDYAEALIGAAMGDKDETLKWEVYLQPLGISFSKGFPGGPGGGTLRAAEEKYMRSIRRHSKEIRRFIENKDFDGALEEMQKAGMRPQEMKPYLKRKAAPHMTEKQIIDFLQIADEAETKRLMHQLERFYGVSPQD